jgi:hypothetical protein
MEIITQQTMMVDKTGKGIEGICWTLEGNDYPRLWWETAEQ